MTIPVKFAGVSGISSVSGISRKRCGMPKPLTLKDSPGRGRWHESARRGQGVCGADGEGKDADKEPDTQRYAPCLSEPSYRNAAGVISPGLPSQALARQLPQSGSPWQRGVVFDETDWGLLENVTECQSLSLWERWHGEAVTERARMLTKSKKHSDTSPVCQRHRIAVLSCFIWPGLPSQALARQLSQRESPWQRGQALVYASMPWSAGG